MSANKAFFILLISFTVALLGLATVLIKSMPLILSHAVYICQQTFSNVLFSISHSVLLLITLVITVLFIGLIALGIQVTKTRNYLKKNLGKKTLIPYSLATIAEEFDLKNKLDVVKDENKFSFCYGLLKPRICLSTGLLKTLTDEELRAVLLHESYHVQNRDPLKIILGRTASKMFFFIPILKDIQNFYTFSKEIAADEIVIKNGKKESLISVLSKLLAGDSLKFSGIAALAGRDGLEKRILYLTGNQRKAVFKPSFLSISLSTFIVLFSFVLVNTPVYAVRADDSCKAKEAVSYSKDLMYTPASYTPK